MIPVTEEGLERIVSIAKKMGASDGKPVRTEEVVVRDWVRLKCQFGCDDYGKRLMCPPYVLTPEEFRKVLSEYEWAILFKFEAPSGSVDEKISYERSILETIVRLEREVFLMGYYAAFGLAAGPCPNCAVCNLEGCKNPYLARPSMEGCGIDVFATARNAGFELQVVRDYEETPTFYAILLIA